MKPYETYVEREMISFYESLPENKRREYAAIESDKIWHWWWVYISKLLWCSLQLITRWRAELEEKYIQWNKYLCNKNELDNCIEKKIEEKRIRKKWWWRKWYKETHPNIDKIFEEVLKEETAWDPMNEKIKWTNLWTKEIIESMEKKWIKISKTVVKKLLKEHWYKKRSMKKTKTMWENKDREEQFKNIGIVKEEYMNSNNPILSMDTKKKS